MYTFEKKSWFIHLYDTKTLYKLSPCSLPLIPWSAWMLCMGILIALPLITEVEAQKTTNELSREEIKKYIHSFMIMVEETAALFLWRHIISFFVHLGYCEIIAYTFLMRWTLFSVFSVFELLNLIHLFHSNTHNVCESWFFFSRC